MLAWHGPPRLWAREKNSAQSIDQRLNKRYIALALVNSEFFVLHSEVKFHTCNLPPLLELRESRPRGTAVQE